jgi:general secretion pathway protein H
MISATGTCNSPHRRCIPATVAGPVAGFTLLELLVVMVLISIIFTFAMLSMHGDRVSDLMQQESRRMETLLNLASDEAVVKGEELAVRFNHDSYEFMRLGDSGWSSFNDGLLKEYRMPADIDLQLDVSGDPPALGKKKDDDTADLPQVFILSSGEMTPFSVQFRSSISKREYLLQANVLGTVSVSSEDTY